MKSIKKIGLKFFVPLMLVGSVVFSSCSSDDASQRDAKINAPDITNTKNYTNKIEVEWDEISDAKSYELRYSTEKNMTEAVSEKSAPNPFVLNKLTAGTKYYLQVRANDGSNWSDWSETKETKTAAFSTVVETYNLLSSKYDYKFPNNTWNSRKEAFRDIVLQSDPDILAVQEGQIKSQVTDLESLLSSQYSAHISDRNITARAIFWKKDKYSLVEFDDNIDMYDKTITGHPLQQYPTYVRLKEKTTNKEIMVFTIHPPTGRELNLVRLRKVMTTVLASKAKAMSRASDDTPVVVMGDFNNYFDTVIEGIPSGPLVLTKQGFTDTFAVAAQKTNPDYKTHDGIESGVATQAKDGKKRIDYIFTYPEERVAVSDYEIVINFQNNSKSYLQKPIPSDHRPVKSTLHISY